MKKTHGILLLLGVALFGYGLYHLFQLRFAGGDNYPEYSSLRADPLGSKALFESLQPLIKTERNFRGLGRLNDGAATTLLFLGVSAESFRLPPAEWRALETFARSGGRLVIALFPAFQKRWPSAFPLGPGNRAFPPVAGTNAPGGPPEPLAEMRPLNLTERWSVRFDYVALERDGKGSYIPAQASRRDASFSLPDELAVHSACTFGGLDATWQVLYGRRGQTNNLPVLIQRSMGRGSVVVAADSFLFSNEALRLEPNATLLSWMLGANRRVLFDETHLGVAVEPGLASLAREYHLGGAFVALLVLAGLFVWKNSASFLPRQEPQTASPENANLVAGRDSASGFINLLRRHLPPAQLMTTCLEEWNTECGATGRPAHARWEAMQQRINFENAKEPHERQPVTFYRDLAVILSRRSPRPSSTSSTSST